MLAFNSKKTKSKQTMKITLKIGWWLSTVHYLLRNSIWCIELNAKYKIGNDLVLWSTDIKTNNWQTIIYVLHYVIIKASIGVLGTRYSVHICCWSIVSKYLIFNHELKHGLRLIPARSPNLSVYTSFEFICSSTNSRIQYIFNIQSLTHSHTRSQ